MPWSHHDDGTGELQQGQDIPGPWDASINMDKKVCSPEMQNGRQHFLPEDTLDRELKYTTVE